MCYSFLAMIQTIPAGQHQVHLAKDSTFVMSGSGDWDIDVTVSGRCRLFVVINAAEKDRASCCIQLKLEEENSHCEMGVFALQTGNSELELSVHTQVLARQAAAHTNLRAVLLGSSAIKIDAQPHLAPGAVGAENHLEIAAMPLSAAAKVQVRPGLYVAENRVAGASHAFSIARPTTGDLLFCATRGLCARQTRQLFLEEFFAGAASKYSAEKPEQLFPNLPSMPA